VLGAAQAQDHHLALNRDVTAETIGETVCIAGYTAHLRPGSDFVSKMKDRLGHEHGLAPEVAEAMILDHIVPLCLDTSGASVEWTPAGKVKTCSEPGK
jgi:hypothetical protein